MCVIFLSLFLLDVVRRQVLLQVKVSNNHVSWGSKKVPELVVENNLAAVLGMLKTFLSDILVNELGNLGAGDEVFCGKREKFTQLRCDFLFAVEAVVLRTLLSLLTIRVFLGVLNLTHKFTEILDIVAEGGDFGFNGFKRHYIYLTDLIFKSR